MSPRDHTTLQIAHVWKFIGAARFDMYLATQEQQQSEHEEVTFMAQREPRSSHLIKNGSTSRIRFPSALISWIHVCKTVGIALSQC